MAAVPNTEVCLSLKKATAFKGEILADAELPEQL